MLTEFRSHIRNHLPYPLKAGVRYSRRFVGALKGEDHVLRCDVQIPKLRLGTGDGDWVVAQQLLAKESIIYSVGLGDNISFDLELIQRFGSSVFGFDPTPFSLSYLRTIQLPSEMRVFPLALATYDGTKIFGAPETPDTPSFSSLLHKNSTEFEVLKLSSMMRKLGHSRIDLLKMDIEGDEYDVLEQMLQERILPAQLLVEFHYNVYGIPLSRTLKHVELLRSAGYNVFDISPVGREFSFVLDGSISPRLRSHCCGDSD